MAANDEAPPPPPPTLLDEDFQQFRVSAEKIDAQDGIPPPSGKEEETTPLFDNLAPADATAAQKDPATATESVEECDKSEVVRRGRFVTPQDFELLRLVGVGAFGKVLQVRCRTTRQVFAMKVMSKDILREDDSFIVNIRAERDILTKVRHAFVVAMHCSFQTRDKLFLVMDFMAGGELFVRLARQGILLERPAAFYVAEMVLALEHLHGLGIVHRDLKPENILLAADGHLCLTDFGLAKDLTLAARQKKQQLQSQQENGEGDHPPDEEDPDAFKSYTLCGTELFMSPEMIAKNKPGYGKATDFWSLGCITYELLAGVSPFEVPSKEKRANLYERILKERIRMPQGASCAACHILKGLLQRDPAARLGATKGTMFQVGGIAKLKQEAFFAHLDWAKLLAKELEPPLPMDSDDNGGGARRTRRGGHDKNNENDTDDDDEMDLRHFQQEIVSCELSRSLKVLQKRKGPPQRYESHDFPGFSFVHDDFPLPERKPEEADHYWNNVLNDFDSVSEVSSGILDAMDDDETPLEDEKTKKKKKKGPRKRKKKGAAAKDEESVTSQDTAATPVPRTAASLAPAGHDAGATSGPAAAAAAPPPPVATTAPTEKPQTEKMVQTEKWQTIASGATKGNRPPASWTPKNGRNAAAAAPVAKAVSAPGSAVGGGWHQTPQTNGVWRPQAASDWRMHSMPASPRQQQAAAPRSHNWAKTPPTPPFSTAWPTAAAASTPTEWPSLGGGPAKPKKAGKNKQQGKESGKSAWKTVQ